jgi:hypothetical protein
MADELARLRRVEAVAALTDLRAAVLALRLAGSPAEALAAAALARLSAALAGRT